jgi:tetratricopeptide (TPR) repeat protein
MTARLGKRKRLLVLLLLIFSLGVTGARAQDTESFENGLQLYFQENYEDARDRFRSAAQQDTQSARTQFFLGNTLNRLGDTTEAIQQYKRTISLQPSHQSARRKLADLYFQAENWSEVISHYEYLIQRNPEKYQFHFRLGVALFNEGYQQEAKSRLMRSKQLRPDSAEAHYYLGRILMANGEYLNASSRFDRAIELDSSQGRSFFYRGLANFRSEDYRSSKDPNWTSAGDFKRAIKEGFNSPRTRFMYANSLLNRGLFYSNRDRIEESVKTLKQSVRQYRKVLAIDWKASNAFHNMGVAYLEVGKLKLAKEAVEKAIMAETSTPFFHDTFGEIYFRLGQFDKAIESWNFALELDSSYENHPFEPLMFEQSPESRIEEAQLRR